MQTDRQTWAYLLCKDCEDILNKGGESWTIPKLATIKRSFPLYDLLMSGAPAFDDEEGRVYFVSQNPHIDAEKLTHFAIGIFWKASVHPWRANQANTLIELGTHSNNLRAWLRGENTFPQDVCLTLTVSKPEQALITLNAPVQSTFAGWPTFLLHVPGVLFTLSVGEHMPVETKMTCFHQNPTHPIFMSEQITGKFNGFLGEHYRESRKTHSYLRSIAARSKSLKS